MQVGICSWLSCNQALAFDLRVNQRSLSDSGSFRARSQILERRSSVTAAAAVVFVQNLRGIRLELDVS